MNRRRTALVAASVAACALLAGALRPQIKAQPMRKTTSARPRIESLEPRALLDGDPTTTPAAIVQGAGGSGINLDGNTDWSTAAAWVDTHNVFRRWGQPDQPWNENPNLSLTADGYPTTDAGTLSYLAGYPDGTYSLSYKGTATVTLGGMGTLNGPLTTANGVTTGSVVVNHSRGDLLTIKVTGLDPASPLDNLRLIAPGYAPDTTQVFTNDFLHRLQPFSTIRYLGWTDANGTAGTAWADRVTGNDFLQTGPQGVSYDDIIALANASGKDAWITLPDQVSDDYVTSLATLMKAELKSGINVYLEYSNELWNGSFPQSHRVTVDARANPLLTKTDDFGRTGEQAAFKLKHFADLFDQVFADQSSRVKPVLCGQDANTYFLDCGLAFLQQTCGDPSGYLSGIGIAPYVDLDNAVDQTGLTMDGLFASMNQFIANELTPWVQSHAALARQYKLPLLAYEGGQSLMAFNPAVGGNINVDLKTAAQNDPRMGDLYRSINALWRQNGGGLFDYFTMYSAYDNSGYWGLLPSANAASSPKWDAVLGLTLPGGDATLDGVVNYNDFTVLKAHWGQTGVGWEQGDFNHDGAVNGADLTIFRTDAQGLTPDQQADVNAFVALNAPATPEVNVAIALTSLIQDIVLAGPQPSAAASAEIYAQAQALMAALLRDPGAGSPTLLSLLTVILSTPLPPTS